MFFLFGMGKFILGVMFNYIWFVIILLLVIVGMVMGKIEVVMEVVIESVGIVVEFFIGLIGIMVLWLGMMKIVEVVGLVELIVKLVKFIIIKFFFDVFLEYLAIGFIVLNMFVNILGLGNVVIFLGLKVM